MGRVARAMNSLSDHNGANTYPVLSIGNGRKNVGLLLTEY